MHFFPYSIVKFLFFQFCGVFFFSRNLVIEGHVKSVFTLKGFQCKVCPLRAHYQRGRPLNFEKTKESFFVELEI